jgi:CBS domain containing-hemolysin-like protein
MSDVTIPVMALQFTAVALLVLLNGFFVGAEFALVKIRETQLQTLAQKGHRRAKAALEIVGNLDGALSATQLGITLASLGLGWLGKSAFANLLSPFLSHLNVGPAESDWIAFAIGFTVITFLHIVAGELAPKSLAIQKPLATSLWVAQPLQWFYRLFYPVIWVLNHAAFWVLRRFGLDAINEAQLGHSEEEIRLILGQNRRHSTHPLPGHDIALNAFDLPNRVAREIMHPRLGIVALDTEATICDCLAIAEQTRYSRFPLCEGGNIDRTLGVVHSKDLVSYRDRARCGRDLQSVARKLVFVPETAPLDKLLGLFLERRGHLALVVDEYGGTVGLLTLEDVLEEIVGPIEDEFDNEKQLVFQTGVETYEMSGALPMHRLAEIIAESIEGSHQVSTLSGWVIQKLGRFPGIGDEVIVADWILRVEVVARTRAERLTLEKQSRHTPRKAA